MSQGIKETKEALKGILILAALLADRFKDGVQTEDAAAIFTKLQLDEEFKKCLVEAYNGAELVPSEVKDIDIAEALDLVKVCIDYVPAIVAALKKPVVQA